MSTNPISEELLTKAKALGAACNQARLALAGMVSVQSAIDALDCRPLDFTETLERALTELRDRRAADSRANQAVVTEEMVEAAARKVHQLASKRERRPKAWEDMSAQRRLWFLEDARAALTVTAALSRAEGQEPVEVTESDHVAEARNMVELRIIFADDGGPNNLRSVEVENVDGESVAAGTWMDRGDGLRALALTVHKSDLRDILTGDRIRSALVKAPAPAVPDGWKLVPIEPDIDMRIAGEEAYWATPKYEDGCTAMAASYRAMISKAPLQPVATHHHKKRDENVVLIGIGKMQAKHWVDKKPSIDALMKEPPASVPPPSVDMHPVAMYQSTDDGSLWARPIEEWEDGRFEALDATSQPQAEVE